jgi:hypothetical protein
MSSRIRAILTFMLCVTLTTTLVTLWHRSFTHADEIAYVHSAGRRLSAASMGGALIVIYTAETPTSADVANFPIGLSVSSKRAEASDVAWNTKLFGAMLKKGILGVRWDFIRQSNAAMSGGSYCALVPYRNCLPSRVIFPGARFRCRCYVRRDDRAGRA